MKFHIVPAWAQITCPLSLRQVVVLMPKFRRHCRNWCTLAPTFWACIAEIGVKLYRNSLVEFSANISVLFRMSFRIPFRPPFGQPSCGNLSPSGMASWAFAEPVGNLQNQSAQKILWLSFCCSCLSTLDMMAYMRDAMATWMLSVEINRS